MQLAKFNLSLHRYGEVGVRSGVIALLLSGGLWTSTFVEKAYVQYFPSSPLLDSLWQVASAADALLTTTLMTLLWMATGWILLRLNEKYAFMGMRSAVHALLYLFFGVASAVALMPGDGVVGAVFLALSYGSFFAAGNKEDVARNVFDGFLCLSFATLFVPTTSVFIVGSLVGLFLLGVGQLRPVMAAVAGVVCPYAIGIFPVLLWGGEDFVEGMRFAWMTAFNPEWFRGQTWHVADVLLCLMVAALCALAMYSYLRDSVRIKVRYRRMFRFVFFQAVAAFVWMVIAWEDVARFWPMVWVPFSLCVGYYFARNRGRIPRIVAYVMIVYALLWGYVL